jgi:hypothetical protein
MGEAGRNVELLKELEVAKILANILKTNVHVATSLGPYYVIQVGLDWSTATATATTAVVVAAAVAVAVVVAAAAAILIDIVVSR